MTSPKIVASSKNRDELTVAIVDRGGRLYCLACAIRLEIEPAEEGYPSVIRYGTSADEDPCDLCGRIPHDTVEGKRTSDVAPTYRVSTLAPDRHGSPASFKDLLCDQNGD